MLTLYFLLSLLANAKASALLRPLQPLPLLRAYCRVAQFRPLVGLLKHVDKFLFSKIVRSGSFHHLPVHVLRCSCWCLRCLNGKISFKYPRHQFRSAHLLSLSTHTNTLKCCILMSTGVTENPFFDALSKSKAFQILTAASMKMSVLWDVAPCPEDGGIKRPWNVGKLQPEYTAHHPRRQSSSRAKLVLSSCALKRLI